MRVVILGAGSGGLELSTLLSEEFGAGGNDLDITPVSRAEGFVFGFSRSAGSAGVRETLITGLDPARRVARLSDGDETAYDLFLGLPKHRAPDVVIEAGLTVDGWIPVDPRTLRTAFPDVYAIGDEMIAKVEVTFLSGQRPMGELQGPSRALMQDKVDFGRSRVRRWFDREWSTG